MPGKNNTIVAAASPCAYDDINTLSKKSKKSVMFLPGVRH
jgi:hypothetical protein